MQTTDRKKRTLKGRVRLLLTIPLGISEALKERAKFETKCNGGTVRAGGQGKVTVSDLVERIIRERMRPKEATGHNDHPPPTGQNVHSDA